MGASLDVDLDALRACILVVLLIVPMYQSINTCREGASLDVDLDALREAEAAFRLSAQLTGRADLYGPLGDAAGAVVRWLATHEDSAAGMAPAGFEEHEAVMQGQQVRGGGRA